MGFSPCPYCRLLHDSRLVSCPTTGQPLPRASTTPRGHPPARHAGPGPSRAPLLGVTIGGKYDVKSLLGEGGMGAVYEAENIAIGRKVAIKVLHPAQAKKKVAVKRFHQEARAAGRIGHPNICEVFDLGTLDDGSPYLVMERLVGETLAARIARESGMGVLEVIDILAQVLSGLAAAHDLGIIHRDIKPENVFLTDRPGMPPVAKLLDFGVSKVIFRVVGEDEEGDLTRTGMVMGTPYYMSAEQARGERNLDGRVDVYACGVLMYEALTTKRPFSGKNYNALLMAILTGSAIPATQLRPNLPPDIDRILARAMARKREERYQTATEFQSALVALGDAMRGITKVPAPPAPGSGKRLPPSSQDPARASNVETAPEVPSRRQLPDLSSSSTSSQVPIHVDPGPYGAADEVTVPRKETTGQRRAVPAPPPAPARTPQPPRRPVPAPPAPPAKPDRDPFDDVTIREASPFELDEGEEGGAPTQRMDGEQLRREAAKWGAKRNPPNNATPGGATPIDPDPFGAEGEETIQLDSGSIEEVHPAPKKRR